MIECPDFTYCGKGKDLANKGHSTCPYIDTKGTCRYLGYAKIKKKRIENKSQNNYYNGKGYDEVDE